MTLPNAKKVVNLSHKPQMNVWGFQYTLCSGLYKLYAVKKDFITEKEEKIRRESSRKSSCDKFLTLHPSLHLKNKKETVISA